jgi:UPF0755 protein
MNKILKGFCVLLLLGLLALGALWYGGSVLYQNPGPLKTSKVMIIPKGAGASRIGGILESAGVVSSSHLFLLNYYIHGMQKSLRAGEYDFQAQASLQNVIEKISKGDVVRHRLTIPEGLSSFEIMGLINNNEVLGGGPISDLKEGTCLPETYTFERDYSRQKLLNDMQGALRGFLPSLKTGKPLPLPEDQLMTMASLIEKETAIDKERPLIAGVYYNRLAKGMLLQCDPTVIYALYLRDRQPLGRALTREDLKVDLPYNTYVRKGLPPGPICHPGKASIRAAYNPQPTDALYFVADGTGGHRFSATLEEHAKNHAHWRRVRDKK